LPARGPLQMPGVQKPNVVEAHAMELIKSMLYLADTTGHFPTQASPIEKKKKRKRKEKTTPFGVNLMRSQELYWAAQEASLML